MNQARFGVVGVRGFSLRHIEWIERAIAAGAPARFAAVATIEDGEEELCRRLAGNGVAVVKDYADLLAMRDDIDIVTLPVGIHLHVPLAVQALEAGYSVYMEKPLAGDCAQAAVLAAAERNARGRNFLGFQTMYQPSTWVLKRRLLDGVVGTVEKIVITVMWPRPASYYTRNAWAGRMEYKGVPIYDCPIQNAAAHFLHTALFLAGKTERGSAIPSGVKAELYHANDIACSDSTFARFSTREGVDIVFNASHCVATEEPVTMDIHGTGGRIVVEDKPERLIAPWKERDSFGEWHEVGAEAGTVELFSRVAEAFLDPGFHEVCTLDNGIMHTLANELAFAAAPVTPFPAAAVEKLPWGEGDSLMHVAGMELALADMREIGLLPGEAGVGWSVPGGALGRDAADALLAKVIPGAVG